MKLSIFTEDLSTETLNLVKKDLSKYAHLAMYRDTWAEIILTLDERERQKNLPTQGVAGQVRPFNPNILSGN